MEKIPVCPRKVRLQDLTYIWKQLLCVRKHWFELRSRFLFFPSSVCAFRIMVPFIQAVAGCLFYWLSEHDKKRPFLMLDLTPHLRVFFVEGPRLRLEPYLLMSPVGSDLLRYSPHSFWPKNHFYFFQGTLLYGWAGWGDDGYNWLWDLVMWIWYCASACPPSFRCSHISHAFLY